MVQDERELSRFQAWDTLLREAREERVDQALMPPESIRDDLVILSKRTDGGLLRHLDGVPALILDYNEQFDVERDQDRMRQLATKASETQGQSGQLSLLPSSEDGRGPPRAARRWGIQHTPRQTRAKCGLS